LLTAAYERRIPTLSSMGAALRTDPTKIGIADIFDTSNCPLARHVRKRLRRRGVGRGIGCVFSSEKVDFDYTHPHDEIRIGSTPHSDRGRERNVLGSLPTVTGIFGLTLANEAIMLLASELGPVFTGETP
jgi:tRNA A37 threonylcarbamoyladenosine dehydratase